MADAKKASLTVLGGPLAGVRCVLPDGGIVSVGSAEGSTLRLDLPGVSPFHARIVVEHGAVTVFETGATRRVHVNDNPVAAGGTALRNGDILWLGTPGEDDVVMLQCVLPRRPADTGPSASSPDVTLAAVPLSELPSLPAPTPDIETTALEVESGRPSEVFPSEGVAEDELVFAEEAPGAAAAEALDETAVFAESAEAAAVPETPEPTAHVVVPDFESAVFVEPEPTVLETPAEPVYEPDFEPGSTVEPTVFIAANEAGFEESIDGGAQQSAASVSEPSPALEPPLPREAPLAPEPPRPAAPPPIPPPERSQALPKTARAETPARAGATPRAHPPSATLAPPAAHPSASHAPSARRAAAPARGARKGGGATRLIVGGLAALVLVAGLGWVGWRYVLPRLSAGPTAESTPEAPAPATPLATTAARPLPATTPQSTQPAAAPVSPEPTPAAVPSGVTPTATPRPSPTPRTSPSPTPRGTPTPRSAAAPTTTAAAPAADAQRAQQTAQLQSLLQEAETAFAARQYEAAIGAADGVLRIEPGHARAGELRADAVRRRDLLRRRFAAGQTVVQTQKAQGGGLAGFDAGDADLRRAPDFSGRIDFEMAPASGLDAGAAWTLRVYVVNDGKKAIRIQGVTVSTSVNGSGSGAAVPARARDIAPQQRALVGETTGTWRDGTTSWSSDVSITANKGDSLRNTLTWR